MKRYSLGFLYRRRGFVKILAMLSGLIVGPQAAAETGIHPASIEVFTTARYPFTGLADINPMSELQVYDLDAPQRLDDALSRGLPADPAMAERLAREHFRSLDPDTLASQVRKAYAGLLKALDYGLDRYPAVVFDNGAVILYGETDLAKALDAYRRWREDRP